MNRGARRAPVFKRSEDCLRFLDILGDVCSRYDLEVHAYSLMPNHYHLLLRSVQGNLSRCLRHINGTYTLWLNRVHRWDGPVFRGRFRNQLIASEEHLRLVLAYIHLNPLRANLVPRLDSKAWTSHRAYIGRDSAPVWLRTDVFMGLLGGPEKLNAFVRSVHIKAIEYPEDFDPESGLFRRKALVRGTSGPRRKSPEQKAGLHTRSVEEVLERVCDLTGATLTELKAREHGPRANPARRFALWALFHRAQCTYREIAGRLGVPYSQVAKLLSRLRRGPVKSPLKDWMDSFRTER